VRSSYLERLNPDELPANHPIMPLPNQLETERLLLRRPELTDAEAVFARYGSDPEVTRYLRWRPSQSADETRAALADLTQHEFAWLIFRHMDGLLLGSIGVRGTAPSLTLGYCLARDAWGSGYATEAVRAVLAAAFEDPAVFRVQATCAPANTASLRVLKKAGLSREGTLRRHSMLPNVSDVPHDVHIYAIIRPN
jgi:RimJ/RimL family protein N-acetyltransferase